MPWAATQGRPYRATKERIMRIKRIHATDMRTAMERVRDELGPDAVIVSTRTLGSTREERRRGLQGVEVVAGLDERSTVSAVAEARTVAQNAAAAVAPGAARAAYALEMASQGQAARAPGLPLAAVSTPAPGREAVPPVNTPRFPRVTREGADELDLDALVPALRALAARKADLSPVPSPSEEGSQGNRRLPVPPLSLREGSPGVRSAEHDASDPESFAAVFESMQHATRPASVPFESTPDATPSTSTQYAPRMVANYIPEHVPSPSTGRGAARARLPGRAGAGRGEDLPPATNAAADLDDAHAAAERAFTLLCAIGLSEAAAESALEEAIRILPPTALSDTDRLLEAGLARLVAGIPAAPALTGAGLAGRAVFFTGPAGVGKTTALLKAAAELRRAGADVGIAGADVSRIGAPEQILRYGELLRLPAEITYTADDLAAMLAAAPEGRVTLVDTPACGGTGGTVDDLSALLAAAPDPLVVLTVAAGAGEREIERLTVTAGTLGAEAVALMKLDESPDAGAALNVVAGLRLPPLLCSHGRDVLADVAMPTVTDLAAEALEMAQAAGGEGPGSE